MKSLVPFKCIGIVLAVWSTNCQAFPRSLLDGSPPRVEGRPPPRAHRVPPGGSLRLRCPVTSHSAPFSVEWFKDDERVDPATWSHHSVAGRSGRTLKIRRIGQDEAGVYTCKGVNGYGSEFFEFTVVVADGEGGNTVGHGGKTTELLPNVLRDVPSVPAGSSFSLRCSVRGAAEMTEMRWLRRVGAGDAGAGGEHRKDVVKLDDGRQYKLLKSSVNVMMSDRWERAGLEEGEKPNVRHFMVTVSDSRPSDSGVYVCLVINSLSTDAADKSLRYDSAHVNVIEGQSNGKHKSQTALLSSESVDSSSSDGGGGLSGLTVAVIVLPVVTVALVGILFLVCRSESGRDSSNSSSNNNKPSSNAKKADLDSSREANSSVALLQASDSFVGKSFPVMSPPEDSQHCQNTVSSNSSSDSTKKTKYIIPPPSHSQSQTSVENHNHSLKKILGRPRLYQMPGRNQHSQGNHNHSQASQQNWQDNFAGISRHSGSSRRNRSSSRSRATTSAPTAAVHSQPPPPAKHFAKFRHELSEGDGCSDQNNPRLAEEGSGDGDGDGFSSRQTPPPAPPPSMVMEPRS